MAQFKKEIDKEEEVTIERAIVRHKTAIDITT